MKNAACKDDPTAHALRLKFLDALRGIAIVAVFLFHTYTRWPGLYPYGDQYAHSFSVNYGWLGVPLFFLISGFVIFMTLEKSTGTVDFLKRRWLRLFPAMLICSLIIYCTASFFPFRPGGALSVRDLLPGLTFIDPQIWAKLLRSPQGVIDEAFWSLFIEAEFYVFAGSFYFLIGRRNLILLICAVFTVGGVLSWWKVGRLIPALLFPISVARQFGWFATGALFYCFFFERRYVHLLAAIGLGLIVAAELSHFSSTHFGVIAAVVIFFMGAVCSSYLQRALAIKPLIFLGFISYPFYLMHQNISVSSIVQLSNAGFPIPSVLLPIVPFCIVVGMAYIVAYYGEPSIRAVLRRVRNPSGFEPVTRLKR